MWFPCISFRQASETLRQLGWDLEVAADTIFSQDMGNSDESEEEYVSNVSNVYAHYFGNAENVFNGLYVVLETRSI